MTFDDDFIRLEMDGGTRTISCKSAGIDWPPPEKIRIYGFDFARESFSEITDDQRRGTGRVMRGAVYQPFVPGQLQQPGARLH